MHLKLRHLEVFNSLIDAPVPVPGLNAEQFDMECVCIMPEEDPLAAKKVIDTKSLEGRFVVTITGGLGVDRQLNQLPAETGTNVIRSVSSYFFAIARNIVAAGYNLAIIDPINGRESLLDGVTWRPFSPRK